MQSINSSVNNALGTGNNVPISSARVKKSADAFTGRQVTETQPAESKNKTESVEQALTSKKQTQKNEVRQSNQSKQTFELDAATIAFLEKNRLEGTPSQTEYSQSNQAQNQLLQPTDATTDFTSSSQFIAKDQVSLQNQTAVSSYQRINNLAQRESVQKLLGIDLYA